MPRATFQNIFYVSGLRLEELCHSGKPSELSPFFCEDSFCEHVPSCSGVKLDLPTNQTVDQGHWERLQALALNL